MSCDVFAQDIEEVWFSDYIDTSIKLNKNIEWNLDDIVHFLLQS